MTRVPIVLTIAGSDSGGGAGIQADIKAMSANRVYAASVITALTAQNTRGVTAIHDVPPEFVTAQIDALAALEGLQQVSHDAAIEILALRIPHGAPRLRPILP